MKKSRETKSLDPAANKSSTAAANSKLSTKGVSTKALSKSAAYSVGRSTVHNGAPAKRHQVGRKGPATSIRPSPADEPLFEEPPSAAADEDEDHLQEGYNSDSSSSGSDSVSSPYGNSSESESEEELTKSTGSPPSSRQPHPKSSRHHNHPSRVQNPSPSSAIKPRPVRLSERPRKLSLTTPLQPSQSTSPSSDINDHPEPLRLQPEASKSNNGVRERKSSKKQPPPAPDIFSSLRVYFHPPAPPLDKRKSKGTPQASSNNTIHSDYHKNSGNERSPGHHHPHLKRESPSHSSTYAKKRKDNSESMFSGSQTDQPTRRAKNNEVCVFILGMVFIRQ